VALVGDHDVVVGIVLNGEEQRHVASGEAQMPPLRSQSRLRVLSLIETGPRRATIGSASGDCSVEGGVRRMHP
jgi:hypothetical protein